MTTKTSFVLTTTIAAALSALAISTSPAAVISWGAPQNIAGDSDVLNSRPIVGAFNVGDGASPFVPYPSVPATTVNGVTFQPFVLDSSAGPVSSGAVLSGGVTFTLSTADLFISDNTAYGSGAAPFTSLSSSYQDLLRSSTITSTPATFDLTMTGLTVGTTYSFQWWSNTSDLGSQLHTATSGGGVTLNDNVSGANGGLGQYAIGTFTADAATQVITFSPDAGPNQFAQLNGFLLAVPEPTTALFGLALFGVCFGGRRRPTQGNVKA